MTLNDADEWWYWYWQTVSFIYLPVYTAAVLTAFVLAGLGVHVMCLHLFTTRVKYVRDETTSFLTIIRSFEPHTR